MLLRAMTAIGVLSSVACADDLLVGSWGTHSVRRYDVNTNAYLGDLIGAGVGGLSTPDGLTLRSDGVLLVSSSDTDQVLQYDVETGAFLGVLATSPVLDAPGNLQIGPDGLLYVCNKFKSSIERLDAFTGEHIDTFAQGNGLITPVGLEWHDGALYVADFNADTIHRYDEETGEKLESLTTSLATPLILRVDQNGDMLATSHELNSVKILDVVTGEVKGTIDTGPITCPVGHLEAPDGTLIVASWGSNRILRYDANYEFVEVFAFGEGLSLPNDLLMVSTCDADCNKDCELNVVDFVCFQLEWQDQSEFGDCDGNGVYNILDFVCFQTVFVDGCK